jgi:hypothetical protein
MPPAPNAPSEGPQPQLHAEDTELLIPNALFTVDAGIDDGEDDATNPLPESGALFLEDDDLDEVEKSAAHTDIGDCLWTIQQQMRMLMLLALSHGEMFQCDRTMSGLQLVSQLMWFGPRQLVK